MLRNNSINLDGESYDLLLNNEFISLFSNFFSNYIELIPEEEFNEINKNFIKNINSEWFEEIMKFLYWKQELDEYFKIDYFDLISSFFSSSNVIWSFANYLFSYSKTIKEQHEIDEYKKIVELFKYIVNLSEIYDRNSKKIDILKEWFKKKASDILIEDKGSQVSLDIISYWYPPIVDWKEIVEFDIKDQYVLHDFIYIKVKDIYNNTYYINKNWITLKWTNGIPVIEVKSLFTFWKYIIYSYKDKNLHEEVSIFTFEWESALNKFTDVIQTNISHKEKSLDYLLFKTIWWYTVILNENIQNITLLDYINFVNNTSLESKKSNINDGSSSIAFKSEDLYISSFWVEYNFLETYFREINCIIWDDIINTVIDNKWNALKDWFNYIDSLWDLKNILWKHFVSFYYWNFIQWFIDVEWKVLKIKGENVISIEKTEMFIEDERVYKYNWNKIIREDYLYDELIKYKSFSNILYWDEEINKLEYTNNEDGSINVLLFSEKSWEVIFNYSNYDEMKSKDNLSISIYNNIMINESEKYYE